MGGPAGGSAGRGGNVWAVADTKYNSLFNFRTKVHWRAKNGGNGTGANCDGADASDLFIPVPLGTIVRRKGADEGEPPLAELLKEGEKALLLVGGRGGRGNSAFKTSRNNAPTIAERGEKGPEAWMELELKVVADCGIVGVPNAGKSTLLSVLTAARPKIANYPFTTLPAPAASRLGRTLQEAGQHLLCCLLDIPHTTLGPPNPSWYPAAMQVPNLGVCERDFRTTVFADVPGLLEGAHEGLGLGHEFLRHVKRCRSDASDLFIPVPLGTIVRRKGADEGEPPLAELLKEGEKALLLVGGRGGRGNSAFKTSRNNAPTIAERGEKGPEAWMELELKVVADCGIVGVPNAGKSTLLSVLTAARPKIANYPFTTLVPNLGVCERDFRTTVFADVPGLLEGAHEGLGLGHEFLRHVKRCRALVHVIDGTSPDPLGDWDAINLELELFSPDLKDKPQAGP
ncbi:predicted protein [Haematococcus lacustris]|uniref:OBG-type G domain-containing protein n=1 Tax=Haematococcus lacustris TaxID=44745 RepID=A0A699YMY5_HAELA|nr:predicted protein [Haematococcus lacustris]